MRSIPRLRLLAGAAAAAALSTTRRAGAAQFEYKFAHNQAVDSALYVRTSQLWKAVANETGGRLVVTEYPNSILGGETQMLSQLRLGALQFFALSGTSLSSVVPAAGLEALPFAFKNYREAYGAFDGALGKYIRSEIESKGIQTFGRVMGYGFFQFTNNVRPIRSADDMVGLKFRTAVSKIQVDTFKSLGAQGTPLNLTELYTALQTHVVDGQTTPYPIIESQRYYEVQKYLSEVNIAFAFPWMMANPEAWKALGPDIQAIVERNATKYALLQRQDTAVVAAALVDKLTRQGMVRNVADPKTFRDKLAASGFYDRWKEEFGAKPWALMEQYTGKLGTA